ncbi:MAG: deoxyguanosinetriphosphate triphosphohydrolase [Planctomycetota bacterium]|nr:deoxyguanosinetriphosphate triphosphohydrolase [Planctomycetota bacterium]
MLVRRDFEQRELDFLAPYAAKAALTRGREYGEKEHPLRTAFQRDRDRVVYSTAFRRLEYKTQVFVNHEGDHYRTRLTHTMEVAQISRGIARALNLNEDLTEAVALAHDIGHGPFGHAGEEALHGFMEKHGGFEHNSQGLRVVELLEHRYPGFQGLNLTWETRESMRKHVTIYDTPVETGYCPEWQPLLEAQVVNVADMIAFTCHDLEDALRGGLIDETQVSRLELWREASRHARCGALDAEEKEEVRRAQVVRHLINIIVTDAIENTSKAIKRSGIAKIEDVRTQKTPLVAFSKRMRAEMKRLQDFLFNNVYLHYRVSRMAKKAKRFLEELFLEYVKNPGQMPPRFQRWAKDAGIQRAVCDYIAGMTDRYAQEEYKKLFYPFERV